MRYWIAALAAATALSLSGAGAQEPNAMAPMTDEERADEATLETGRAFTRDFQERRFDALWDRMTDEMRQVLGSRDALEQLRKALGDQFGEEGKLLSETADVLDGHRIYLRTAEHDNGPPPIVTQWTLDGENRIAGFFVRPAQQPAESRFLDYRTKAALRLPFDGEWHVFWGGRTAEENYHVVDAGQRFASDFMIMRDGSTHEGDGQAVENYHCWDEPVLAPAEGTVAAIVDGLPDMEIGKMDPANPAGNHVVLDLGNDEFAFLAHLRNGSVAVEEGDQVTQGAELGRCGNSGNSSEPHLHLHLQNTPVLGEGDGLPAFFRDYSADGKRVEEGEPVKGQMVSAGD